MNGILLHKLLLTTGVPQGSALSPLLFSFCTRENQSSTSELFQYAHIMLDQIGNIQSSFQPGAHEINAIKTKEFYTSLTLLYI